MTIDGFIADPQGGFGFLDDFPPPADFDDFLAEIGTVLVGRATFDQMVALPEGLASVQGDDRRVIVLTRRPVPGLPPRVEACGDPPAVVAKRLRAEESRDVWHMGGGRSVRPYIEAGLIDEIDVSIVPVTLGAGLPLLGTGLPFAAGISRWRLSRTQGYPGGLVRAIYSHGG